MIRCIFIFIFGINNLFAQSVSFTPENKSSVKINGDFKVVNTQITRQYLLKKWSNGTLFYLNGNSKYYDSLNFDRYSNRLEVAVNNKILTLLPTTLSGVVIRRNASSGYIIMVVKIDNENKFILTESTGNITLGSYLLVSKPETTPSYVDDEVRFVVKEEPGLIIKEIFILLNNQEWHRFKLSKPSIRKLFKIDKKEFQKIASENDINITARNGLILMFQLLNK